MIYREHPVSGPLAEVVRRIWYLEAEPQQPYERILPMPLVHCIVNRSAPYSLIIGGEPAVVPDAFVAGVRDDYLVSMNPPTLRHVGFECVPERLGSIALTDAGAVGPRVVDARRVFDGVEALQASLDAADAAGGDVADSSLSILVAWIEDRLTPVAIADPVADAIALLRRDPTAKISELVDAAGLTHQAFIDRFRAQAGLTPKQYAQVARFSAFVGALRFGEDGRPWARLAAESDYYDQPEVVRAFRRFSGWTPTEYARRLADYGPAEVNFVPTSEP